MKLNKEILRLAIPNIISNISVPLISSVDTALMGGLSSLHIGAVGVGAMVFNFIYWNFGFLRMGTTGLTAQAYGAKDKTTTIHTLARALLLAVGFGSLIILLRQPLEWISFNLMNVSAAQYELIAAYFYIRIWAAPLTLALITMMGWFFGVQNAIYPLILTIIINIANIGLSYLLVVEYDMGVRGVAYGTVLAQAVGLLAAFVLFAWKYRGYQQVFDKKMLFAKEGFVSFLQVNSDIFLRTFCLTLVLGFFFRESAMAGAELLAISTILMQFVNWMSFGVDGFAYAAESLVGKYKGAKENKNIQKVIKLSMRWGILLGALYSLVYGFFGMNLLSIFTDEKELIAAAMPYLWWMVLLPIVGTPCYIWDGIFVGLTASKAMRNSMFVAMVLYFLTYYTSFYYYDNELSMVGDLLWASLCLFLTMRGLIQWLLYKSKGENLI